MKKKIIILSTILIVLAVLYSFDFIRSKQFTIEVQSIFPNPAVADGETPIEIKVKLTDRKGEPVSGHYLFAISKGGGMFRANREETSGDGLAVFTYFPYRASATMQLRDVAIEVLDESNSIFFEVNTSKEFVLSLQMPEGDNGGSRKVDDIFGE